MSAGTVREIDQSTAGRYEALIRILHLIREAADPQDLFNLLVEELGKVVPFDALAQFDESSNRIRVFHGPACREVDRGWIPEDDVGLPHLVFRNQEAILLRAQDNDPRFPTAMRLMTEMGLQSVFGFPLTTAHRRLGSLVFGSVSGDAYGPEEVRFCSLVVNQIALAMDDAMNFSNSKKAQERLELLLDLTNRVASHLNLRDVLREITAQIRRVMECAGAGICLPSPEDGKLRLYALDHPDARADLAEEGEEATGDNLVLQVFRTGEPLILTGDEIHHDSLAPKYGVRSVAHLPLNGPNGVVGVLTMGTLRDSGFSRDDLPFLTQVAHQIAISVENARTFRQVSEEKNQLAMEKLYLEDELRSEGKFEEIIGRSESLRRVLEHIATVAPTDSTVLIYGETGSGKELIARAVHNLSARKSGAFVKLNCAAIPTGLLESEMFGHERGAFTGAISQRIGRFELANRGSIFLDEIGEIPLELQPKLLRVLQEREFERLGSARTLRTDARLIAATNRDLGQLVEEGKFRPDLFYRLNVFPVRLPALRERPDDIPLLVRHFVQQFSRRLGKTIDAIPAEAMTALTRYPWPGNIRELQNVIERAVILTSGPVLSVHIDELRGSSQPAGPRAKASRPQPPAPGSKNLRSTIEETERQQILAALEKSNWIVAGAEGAAARLGMKRSTLQTRMQKLGIRISRTGAS